MLHVISSANSDNNILSVIIRDRIHCSLYVAEIGRPMKVDGDQPVARWSNPLVMSLNGGVGIPCARHGVEPVVVIRAREQSWCKQQHRSEEEKT